MPTSPGDTLPYHRVRRMLTFGAQRDDDSGLPDVDGVYSRTAWLPVLGPAPWVVWSTIAWRLPPRGFRVWNVAELERVNGLDGAALGVALSQLARFRLAVGRGDDVWSIRRTCPPLPDALLTIAEPSVRVAHRRAFPVGPSPRRSEGPLKACLDFFPGSDTATLRRHQNEKASPRRGGDVAPVCGFEPVAVD